VIQALGLRLPARRQEESEQIALINWAHLVQVGTWHLSDVLWHYPAGGQRNLREAARFKAMGVRKGVPDLQLPIPAGDYVSGWWEIKVGTGRLSEDQIETHALLRACGHYVQTYWHWHEAAHDILRYLEKGSFTVIVRARP